MGAVLRKWIRKFRRRRTDAPSAEDGHVNGRRKGSAVEEFARLLTEMYLHSGNTPLIRFFDEDERNNRRNR